MPYTQHELRSGVDLTKLQTETEMARSVAMAGCKQVAKLADAARVSVHVE